MKYTGRHRRLSDADTDEIERICALTHAPERTMEEIRLGQEPAWNSPTTNLKMYAPRKQPPFSGPPLWRFRDWVAWTKTWRRIEPIQSQSDRVVRVL